MNTIANSIQNSIQLGGEWRKGEWDFFSRTLAMEVKNASISQAFLWKDKILWSYGSPVLAPDRIQKKLVSGQRKMFQEYIPTRMVFTGNFTKDSVEYSSFTSVHSLGRANFILLIIIKSGVNPQRESIRKISQLLESFGYAFPGKDKRLVPLFSDFSDYYLKLVQKKMQDCEYGVITHFYIQDLDKYFQAMGLQKSFEILKSIQSIIGSYIKNDDIFVHQGARSYFVFSPKCKKEIVLNRFEEVFLQVHHLIVDYRMRFLELSKESDLIREWENFLLSEDLS